MSVFFFFFSSRRRHTRWNCDWSSDVCSSDLPSLGKNAEPAERIDPLIGLDRVGLHAGAADAVKAVAAGDEIAFDLVADAVLRSEERRVGKECRSRWSP